jgi:hypothetical protein
VLLIVLNGNVKSKFCADSESQLRIHLSFEIRILDLSQSHTNAHFPDFNQEIPQKKPILGLLSGINTRLN